MTNSFDVAIVGGGLLGWSAAYRLVKAGLSVCVADLIQEGVATNAGAGIIAPGTSVRISPAGLLIGGAAVQYYPELLAELGSDGETNTGYATVGALFVARDDDEADRLAGVKQIMLERRDGGMANIGEVTELSGAEAKMLFPALSESAGRAPRQRRRSRQWTPAARFPSQRRRAPRREARARQSRDHHRWQLRDRHRRRRRADRRRSGADLRRRLVSRRRRAAWRADSAPSAARADHPSRNARAGYERLADRRRLPLALSAHLPDQPRRRRSHPRA